jgi:BRCT domain type II-containing protein
MSGINGAREDALRGKTVVLTGLFPELGGGSGLDLGKERAKAMVEEFGGKVRARRSLVTVDRVLTFFRYTGNIECFRTD